MMNAVGVAWRWTRSYHPQSMGFDSPYLHRSRKGFDKNFHAIRIKTTGGKPGFSTSWKD